MPPRDVSQTRGDFHARMGILPDMPNLESTCSLPGLPCDGLESHPGRSSNALVPTPTSHLVHSIHWIEIGEIYFCYDQHLYTGSS